MDLTSKQLSIMGAKVEWGIKDLTAEALENGGDYSNAGYCHMVCVEAYGFRRRYRSFVFMDQVGYGKEQITLLEKITADIPVAKKLRDEQNKKKKCALDELHAKHQSVLK